MTYQSPPGAARLAIVLEELSNAAVIHVFGEVDMQSAPELDRVIERAAYEWHTVIADFSECRYVDSTTLTVLVRAAKTMGERLRLVVPPGALIGRVFSITQLDKLLCVVPSLDAAIATSVPTIPRSA
jgi:anti-sigma B factor antagonist